MYQINSGVNRVKTKSKQTDCFQYVSTYVLYDEFVIFCLDELILYNVRDEVITGQKWKLL